MSFSSMLEILQEKNKGKIVMIKLGAFYIATGRDATLLHKKLGLKCTCYKNNICKVGIPVTAIEKYIPILDRTKYAYVIYDYDKTKNELMEKCKQVGKKNKIIESNINCLICKGIEKYKDDEYMLALNKLLDSEEKKE